MKRLLYASLLCAMGAATASPTWAQPMGDAAPGVVASQPSPDTAQPSPGIPGPQAVDPAPGAQGPYVGAGRQNFYDIDQRIAAMDHQASALPGSQRRRAAAQLRTIKSEEAFKRSKYGELRDWDREHLSVMLDKLAQQYPGLQTGGPGSSPAQ